MLAFVKSFKRADHEPEDCTLLVDGQHSVARSLAYLKELCHIQKP
jgi:hypothetical protein